MCISCSESLFPFNHIQEDHIFLDVLTEHSSTHVSATISKLNDYCFNPFELNESDKNWQLFDADPDIHYFSDSPFVTNMSPSNYYTEQTFTEKCKQLSINDKDFSLIHLNIRSLPKHLGHLETYLQNATHNFSVIGLSETWLNDMNVDLYKVDGYHHENNYRMHKVGGGVALCIKIGIEFAKREDLTVSNTLLESLFIEIPRSEFNAKKDILIGVMYRPPNTIINEFLVHLSEILSKIRCENKTTYIMGDFNINLLNADVHAPTSGFMETMFANSFFPLITKPTRVYKSSATLIDNIFLMT